jgi:hypothetical protein
MDFGTAEASPTVFSKAPGWRRWLYVGSRPCHCELQGPWIVLVTLDQHRSVAVRLLDDGGARHFWFILRGDAANATSSFSQFSEALRKENPAVEITMQW